GARHNILASDNVGVALDAFGDELRVFDEIRLRVDHPRNDEFSVGQRMGFKNLPFVRVARIRAFERIRTDVRAVYDVDDLVHGYVAHVRLLGIAPAQMQTHAILGYAFERVIEDIDVQLDELAIVRIAL